VGAVVHAHSRKLSAAMSISGPAFRMTKERIPEVAQALMQARERYHGIGLSGAAAGSAEKSAS